MESGRAGRIDNKSNIYRSTIVHKFILSSFVRLQAEWMGEKVCINKARDRKLILSFDLGYSRGLRRINEEAQSTSSPTHLPDAETHLHYSAEFR